MNFTSIKNIVDVLNESMSFVNDYGIRPLDKETLEKFRMLQSRLKIEFDALDIETEFANSDSTEAGFLVRKLDEYLYKPANVVKMMLVKQEELEQRRNVLIERLRNKNEEAVIIHYNAEIFQQVMSFRYDVELCSDSIIVQVDKLRQMCSNPKRVSQLQHEELDSQKRENLQKRSQASRTRNFKDIIQYPDKDKLLERLHELIDGKSGADVGAVLLNACSINPYLTRRPTQAEFESEFELIGSWQAISNYMNENSEKALVKANRIAIF